MRDRKDEPNPFEFLSQSCHMHKGMKLAQITNLSVEGHRLRLQPDPSLLCVRRSHLALGSLISGSVSKMVTTI